jgi:glycerophosphoryl diester phosphodiesterase
VRIVLLLLLGVGFATAQTIASQRLEGTHAHNDYQHKQPLLDALAWGFSSIEADIHLFKGKLYVAHDADKIFNLGTLERLYLEPLQNLVEKRGGYLYPDHKPLTLLIDIKTEAEESYLVLHELLQKYAAILSVYEGDTIREGAINVVISGNRPIELMLKQELRYATFDGRLSDIDANYTLNQMWLISDNARKHFSWRGQGDIPKADISKLYTYCNKVHAKGRKIRFWALWDEPGERRTLQWQLLRKAGVDFINTDDLPGLATFIKAQKSSQ